MTTPSIIQSKDSGPATRTTYSFSPSATGTGNALIVIFATQGSANPGGTGVTDNASGGSNTWSKEANSGTVTGGRYIEVWGTPNAKSVTSITCTNTSANVCWQFFEVDNVAAAPFDGVAANAASAATTTTPCNVTPANANDLIISYVHWNTNTTATISQSTSGYTTDTTDTLENNCNVALATTKPAGTATGVTWTGTSSQGYGQATIALAGSGAPPPPSGGATGTIVQGVSSNLLAARTTDTLTVAATGAGHLLLMIFFVSGNTNPGGTSVSDNASGGSNTWAKVANSTSGTGRYVEVWAAQANTKSITTVTGVNTSGDVGWQFLEIAGCPSTSAIDAVACGAANTSTVSTAVDVTPTTATDFLISFMHWNANATSAITLSAGSVTAGYVAWTPPAGSTIEAAGNIATLDGPASGSPAGPVWDGTASNGYGTATIAILGAIYIGQYKQSGGSWHNFTINRVE